MKKVRVTIEFDERHLHETPGKAYDWEVIENILMGAPALTDRFSIEIYEEVSK